MKSHMKHIIATVLFALSAGIATAASPAGQTTEDKIRAAIAPVLAGEEIEKIGPSPYAGLYEVLTARGMLYTDKTGGFVIFGATLIDTKTKADLTTRRVDEIVRFSFASLPLGDAVKTVRGDGSRVLATFEDPNCGFCKKLYSELQKINNVTVYTFLTPILSPDSTTKAKAIWCSPDRSAAWGETMSGRANQATVAECPTPLERNLALYRKLHLNGTPTTFLSNNKKIAGYVNADRILTLLAERP